jgi:hypothetical protein
MQRSRRVADISFPISSTIFNPMPIAPEKRDTKQRNPSFNHHQRLGPSIRVSNNIVAALLFKVVRAPLSCPADIDLLQGRIAFENTQCSRDHVFVGVFMPFGEGESFEEWK